MDRKPKGQVLFRHFADHLDDCGERLRLVEIHMRVLRTLRVILTAVCLLCSLGISAQAATPIPANHIRIHYYRPDGVYTGWTVYAFGDTTEDQGNFGGGPVQIAGSDSFGVYFDVGVTVAPP